MKKYFLLLLSVLYLFMLACGWSTHLAVSPTSHATSLPPTVAPTLAPEIVPTAIPAPTETALPSPTPTATPDVIPPTVGQPLDPLQLYAYNLATGVWTEGEGLITLLKLYLGEEDPTTVAFSAELDNMELTGVIAQAEAYLATHPDAPEKADLEDLLAPFRITDEALDLYSQPEAEASLPALYARVTASGAVQDTLASGAVQDMLASGAAQSTLCADLFRDGFPPGSATLCYRYASFTDHGNEYRLYYPATWAFDDPRRAKLAPLREAMRLAVTTFNNFGYGPILPTRMVVTELGYVRADGSPDSSVYAQAIRGEEITCRVGVFPSALELDQGEMSQTIAHEMFHCFQFTHLYAQESGPDPITNRWWVEGSAVYFSDIVYPGANWEANWNYTLPNLATRTPLVLWTYPAYAFFEYLGNNLSWTPGQIISLLAAMPTSGGTTEQLDTLTRHAGMMDTFHTFGQALIDNRVRETGGDTIEVDIQPRRTISLPSGVGALDLSPTKAFILDYYEIVLEQARDYTFTPRIVGTDGRNSATLIHTASWTGLPSVVSTACQETRYRVLVTAGHPFTGYSYTLAYETANSTLGCDTCLVGTWQLDTSTYLLLAQSLAPRNPPNSPAPTFMLSAEGEVLFKFEPDGRVTSSVNNLVAHSIMHLKDPETLRFIRTATLDVVFKGGYRGTFSVANGLLTVNNTEGSVDVEIYLDGQLAGQSLPGGAMDPGGLLGPSSQYICTNTRLLIAPTAPIQRVNPIAPWLAFFKVVP